MPAPPIIEQDVPCAACAYNLRGLRIDQRCPECGVEIMHSLRPLLKTCDAANSDWVADDTHWIRHKKFEPIAASTGDSVDAVMFVWTPGTARVRTIWSPGPRRTCAKSSVTSATPISMI